MKFESLGVWVKSKELAVSVYRHFSESRDFGFRDQITRSCLSVASNIAEGIERGTGKDTQQFLRVAKGSCSEFKAQTLVGMGVGYIDGDLGREWLEQAEEIGRMLSGLIKAQKN